jgi:hypothetical protein
VLSIGPVTAIGSVTVNGIRFEDTAANITGDDTTKVLADIRKLGATLKIKGRLNDDGITGVAERIEIENEIRGAIGAITLPDSFTVLGQTVFVDGGTVFADTTGLTGASPLAVNDIVEVHGARDAAGHIRATRVENLGAVVVVDELKGTITAKTGTTSGTLDIGGATYSFDTNTVVVPAGAAFIVGTLVEVHLSGTLVTRLEVEDLDEPEFEPAEGVESHVEGFVTGFVSLSSPFSVGGRLVDASAAKFEGGLPADLANDVKVEAEGHVIGGLLVAERIEFKDSLRIQSTVTAGGVTAGGTGSFTLLGKTIFVTSSTLNNPGDINPSDNVEVRGFLNNDGTSITAARIDSVGSIQSDQHIIQGLVTDKNGATLHLTILGFDVDASGSNGAGLGVEFQDDNDAIMAPIAFFDAVTVGRTVVTARGTPGAGTLTANKVEIE